VTAYYLSNAVREKVSILLNEVGVRVYAEQIKFLKEHLHKFMLETSIDGKIRKAPQVIEGDGIRLEYGPKGCIIYVAEIPKIHEIVWADLINQVEGVLFFPNHCFLINSVVVHGLLEASTDIPTELVYKALLELCDPTMIEEDVFRTLQGASWIPVENDLQNVSNVVLVDQFKYEVNEPQTVQVNPYQIIQLAIGGLDEQDSALLEKF
jgi:hypothetical protein